MTRVLVVGSDASRVATLRATLDENGADVTEVPDAAAALDALAHEDFDCLVAGRRPGVTPDRLEAHLRADGHALPVVHSADRDPAAVATAVLQEAESARLSTTRSRRQQGRTLQADLASAIRECADAADIERTACEHLAGSSLYRAAWIGRWDGERGVVTPSTAVGLEVDSLAEVAGDPEGTVAGRVPVEWTPVVQTDGPHATVGVPLVADDPLGVLQVYAIRPDGVDAPERDRLTEVGAAVGAALADVEGPATTDAEEGLAVLGDTLAHELGNQLDAARVQLELARERDTGDHLERVEDALERIGDLADDAKALARGSLDPEPRPLADAAEEAWAAVETRDATLSVESGSIQADADLLGLLLENLFRNAVEHGPAGTPAGDRGTPGGSAGSQSTEEAVEPTATAATDDRQDGLTVRVGPLPEGFYVEDDGPGIPPEDREAVFEWGYSTRQSSGAGLGIVSLVADRHDWTVTLLDSDAGGARFEFRR